MGVDSAEVGVDSRTAGVDSKTEGVDSKTVPESNVLSRLRESTRLKLGSTPGLRESTPRLQESTPARGKACVQDFFLSYSELLMAHHVEEFDLGFQGINRPFLKDLN